MDKNVKTLFASKAREITDSSTFLLRNVYKWIEDAASRNQGNLILGGYEFDEKVLQNVISELKGAGYKVQVEEDSKTYIINW